MTTKEKLEAVISKEKGYGITLPRGLDNQEIIKTEKEIKEKLDYQITDIYKLFISIVNGLESNGIAIYAGLNDTKNGIQQGIIENNEEWQKAFNDYEIDSFMETIFFAESGLELFGFDKSDKRYKIFDRSSGSINKEFIDFENLLNVIFDEMLA